MWANELNRPDSLITLRIFSVLRFFLEVSRKFSSHGSNPSEEWMELSFPVV